MNKTSNIKITFCPGPGAVLPEWHSNQKEFFGRGDFEYKKLKLKTINWIKKISGQDEVIPVAGAGTTAAIVALNTFLTNKGYRTLTGSIEQQEHEKKRRKGKYKFALDQFQGTNGKSSVSKVNHSYFASRMKTWSLMREELLFKSRQYQRFKLYSMRQKALSQIAKDLLKDSLLKSLKENKKLIGTITSYYFKEHKTVDVGILIGDKSISGSGYGKESWKLYIDHLSAQKNIRKITAGTLSCNISMLKLIEFSDMVPDGTRKNHEIVDNKLYDVLYFAKFINQ